MAVLFDDIALSPLGRFDDDNPIVGLEYGDIPLFSGNDGFINGHGRAFRLLGTVISQHVCERDSRMNLNFLLIDNDFHNGIYSLMP